MRDSVSGLLLYQKDYTHWVAMVKDFSDGIVWQPKGKKENAYERMAELDRTEIWNAHGDWTGRVLRQWAAAMDLPLRLRQGNHRVWQQSEAWHHR